jgi:acyl carrier protein
MMTPAPSDAPRRAVTPAEHALRRVVAESLGVDAEALGPEVSLTDELAADSLDLAELVVRLETDLGVVLPDRVVDRIRTFGDLLGAMPAAAD